MSIFTLFIFVYQPLVFKVVLAFLYYSQSSREPPGNCRVLALLPTHYNRKNWDLKQAKTNYNKKTLRLQL